MPPFLSESKKTIQVGVITEECKECAVWAQHISIAGNIFLAVLKGVVGTFIGSSGLVADAVHSSADVLNSFITLIAVNISEIPPDKNHPYGHGKVENISGVIIGCVLFFGSTSIIFSAYKDLISDVPPVIPHFIGLAAVIISILTNELMYRTEICACKKVNSPAIEAEAWDNRMDAFSSVPVFLGVLGAQMGYPRLDPLAALFIGIVVMGIAGTLIKKNIEGLMDSGLSAEEVDEIARLINSDPEVEGIGYIKTRTVGRPQFIDIEILVNSENSLQKSDEIAKRIIRSLSRKINHLGSTTVVCRPQAERQS